MFKKRHAALIQGFNSYRFCDRKGAQFAGCSPDQGLQPQFGGDILQPACRISVSFRAPGEK
jgi:hypothetical protein